MHVPHDARGMAMGGEGWEIWDSFEACDIGARDVRFVIDVMYSLPGDT